MWQPNDLNEFVLPIFKIWKYTGLPVYKFDIKTRKFVSTNFKTFFIGILAFMTLLYFGLENLYNTDGYIIVEDNVNFVEMLTFFLQNVCMFFACYKKRKQIVKILPELQKSEKLIIKTTNIKKRHYHNIGKKFLVILGAKYILVIMSCLIDCVNIPEEVLSLTIYYTSWCIHFHLWLLVVLYLIILKEQYLEFNQYLIKIKARQNIHCNITEVINTHNILLNHFLLIKNAFEVLWLIKFITDIIITSVGVFYIFQTYMLNLSNLLLTNVSTVLWIILVGVENFLEVFIFHGILNQVLSINTNMLLFF